MRTRIVRTLAPLGVLLLGAGMALAQGGPNQKQARPPKPSGKAEPDRKPAPGLPEMVAEALKNSPDILVAAAKVRTAEAELSRARVQVIQRVVTVHHALEEQKSQVADLQQTFKDRSEAAKTGSIPQQALADARQKLMEAKAKLAELEMELTLLLGRQRGWVVELRGLTYHKGQLPAAGEAKTFVEVLQAQYSADLMQDYLRLAQRDRAPQQAVGRTVAEKLRKALDTPVALQFDRETPLGDVLNALENTVPGVSFRIVEGSEKDGIRKHPIAIRLKQRVPLGAAIQALEDSVPNLRFVVRDYGILVTWKENLPPNAILVEDFWKGEAGGPSKADGPGAGKSPGVNLRGRVTAVDPEKGVVEVSLGSDHGLAAGHTLELVRSDPANNKFQYLGKVRLIEVRATRAVGKILTSRVTKTVRVGDLVFSQVSSR